MADWLNVGSLVLGLTAWFLPVISIMRDKRKPNKNWASYSIMSLNACAIALFCQILYSYHLVRIEDISAIYDTAGGVVLAATVLLIITFILNTINVRLNRIKG
ncbi:hypothetical protein RYX45_06380 [Alkalihalophilus pseudofirmus]|uniref:Cytochrome c oxidase subunit 4 n=1 Tax=Alkalihalophilus pseudofirmus TaxID=79885 RepID=A0AAJ2NKQ0_ALKPS|nr:hypothetical protein [Alkalihalophilus pseudofirmus]MDV2884797.1 hypothetical protein [Alkalihalophilus pseudofirmus]